MQQCLSTPVEPNDELTVRHWRHWRRGLAAEQDAFCFRLDLRLVAA